MDPLQRKLLHDITNKLAKIDGFLEMIKNPADPNYEILLKIEKAKDEAFEVINNFRVQAETDSKA